MRQRGEKETHETERREEILMRQTGEKERRKLMRRRGEKKYL